MMNIIFANMAPITQAPKPKTHDAGKYADHAGNDFGSRTSPIEDDPNWSGFTVPEWMKINTTDGRKKYK